MSYIGQQTEPFLPYIDIVNFSNEEGVSPEEIPFWFVFQEVQKLRNEQDPSVPLPDSSNEAVRLEFEAHVARFLSSSTYDTQKFYLEQQNPDLSEQELKLALHNNSVLLREFVVEELGARELLEGLSSGALLSLHFGDEAPIEGALQNYLQSVYVERGSGILLQELTKTRATLQLTERALENLNWIVDYYSRLGDSPYLQGVNPEEGDAGQLITGSTLSADDIRSENQKGLYDYWLDLKKVREEIVGLNDILKNDENPQGSDDLINLKDYIDYVLGQNHQYGGQTIYTGGLDQYFVEGESIEASRAKLSDLQNYWQQDKTIVYPNGEKEASVSESLRNATAMAQGINDNVKQDLSRGMLHFEDFYKTASSLLRNIDKILSKASAGIENR